MNHAWCGLKGEEVKGEERRSVVGCPCCGVDKWLGVKGVWGVLAANGEQGHLVSGWVLRGGRCLRVCCSALFGSCRG